MSDTDNVLIALTNYIHVTYNFNNNNNITNTQKKPTSGILNYADKDIQSNPNWTKTNDINNKNNIDNKYVAYSNNQVFAIKTDNTLYYYKNYKSPEWLVNINISLIQISFDGYNNIAVGVNSSNNIIYCSDTRVKNPLPPWKTKTLNPNDDYIYVSYSNKKICGITKDNILKYCSDITTNTWSFTKVKTPSSDTSHKLQQVCLSRSDNSAVILYSNTTNDSILSKYNLFDVTNPWNYDIYNNKITGFIYYTNDITVEIPTWINYPNPNGSQGFISISYNNSHLYVVDNNLIPLYLNISSWIDRDNTNPKWVNITNSINKTSNTEYTYITQICFGGPNIAPTIAPTTKAPTTSAPTTKAPTTISPTTIAPTTIAPKTIAPTSKAPTTKPPTTSNPTTVAPTTIKPTKSIPTLFDMNSYTLLPKVEDNKALFIQNELNFQKPPIELNKSIWSQTNNLSFLQGMQNINEGFTNPPVDNIYNNEYIITSLLSDPSISSLYTLDSYGDTWNKANLIQTIQDILANHINGTTSLSQFRMTPNPNVTVAPTQKPKLNYLANNKNLMTITDNNGKTNTFVNAESEKEVPDGDIGFQLQNQSILAGSTINLAYNVPKNDVEDLSGNNYTTLNTGNQKCLYRINCTKKHYYRPNCTTSIDPNNKNCNCKCDDKLIFNDSDEPHTHCITEDLSNSIINYLSNIKSIEVNVPVPSNFKMNNSIISGTVTYDPDIDYLSNLIADYYILLLHNKKKLEQSQENRQLSNGRQQSLVDANELYKNDYIKIINISVGIFTSVYIMYSMLDK